LCIWGRKIHSCGIRAGVVCRIHAILCRVHSQIAFASCSLVSSSPQFVQSVVAVRSILCNFRWSVRCHG
jgi:hypothetical protein